MNKSINYYLMFTATRANTGSTLRFVWFVTFPLMTDEEYIENTIVDLGETIEDDLGKDWRVIGAKRFTRQAEYERFKRWEEFLAGNAVTGPLWGDGR